MYYSSVEGLDDKPLPERQDDYILLVTPKPHAQDFQNHHFFYYFAGWALPTEMPPISIEKAGNARPTRLQEIYMV